PPPDPPDNLRRTEGERDPEDRAQAPTPGHAVCHRHGAERHHENDCDRREPGENVGLKGGGAGHEWGALCERRYRRGAHEQRCEGAPGVGRTDRREVHGGFSTARSRRARPRSYAARPPRAAPRTPPAWRDPELGG